ncbi:MAG: peptidylprolyl isomerase [Lysobacterales bacterium]|nr:peptidyl-prolyl cis-trans isomerase [Xanthomonadales bacterium]MCP5473526.1 peptidyl-prolyl cis-trans isomerase [Rhodanobacteraceae bacterium]
MTRFALAILAFGFAVSASAQTANPRVTFKTNQGDFVIELDAAKAPKTVENFVQYVKAGQYDGTIFHRVIDNFMVQGGGYTTELAPKGGLRAPIQNEADNGLSNVRGSVAMARTMDPHSATAQFFINVNDNKALDHVSKADGRTWGYAVFGKVVSGMDVIDKIKVLPTSAFSAEFQNLPRPYVVVEKATLEEAAPAAKAAGQ